MSTTAERDGDKIARMAKKKTGDRHKVPRVNVSMPEPWHAIARKLAAKRQQPVTFLFIALLKAEAEKQGVGELPSPPWDEGDDAT